MTTILHQVFHVNNRRDIVRTITGLIADVATFGMGGDVIIDSVFAIDASINYILVAQKFAASFTNYPDIAMCFFTIDTDSPIGFTVTLNLDYGFRHFQQQFDSVICNNDFTQCDLDAFHHEILSCLNATTNVVSDWIACLFPDTAGLAGDISKTVLDYISQNNYSYIYNLISFLQNDMQQMLTNSKKLKQTIQSALTKLIFVLNKTRDIHLIYTNQQIVDALNKFTIPHIEDGVDIFHQTLKLYLLFVLFNQYYHKN